VCCLTLTAGAPFAQEKASLDPADLAVGTATLTSYFEALKGGDVAALKPLLTADAYAEYKELIESNTEYPAFLRNYYRDLEYRVDTIEPEGQDLLARVTIKFPDADPIDSTFILRRETEAGDENDAPTAWRIAEQNP
jgi:hypothetical protein